METTLYTVRQPEAAPRLPEYLRSALIDAGGTVFAAAAMAGDERQVVMSAAFEGVTVCVNEGHAYLPVGWMRQEYPRLAAALDTIERSVAAKHAEAE